MAGLLVIVLVVCPLLSVSADLQQQQITARPGDDDVTLSCQAPNNVAIAVVEWSRPDLKKLVFLKRDGHLNTAVQDPSYKNRVQLTDDEMKNGNLSLVLKKVDDNDGGRYECRYVEERGGRRKRADQRKLLSIVQLNVEGDGDQVAEKQTGGDQEAGGQRGGDTGGEKDVRGNSGVTPATLTVVAAAAAVVVALGVVIFKNRRGRSESKSDQPGDDPDVLQQLQQNETSQKSISHNTSDIQV